MRLCSDSTAPSMVMDTTIAIKEQTHARGQFIALSVGVIVGRCGCGAPVSALTPSLLSLIGQEWVVVPARNLVVGLVDAHHTHNFVKFSVSPTLGLVGHPKALVVDLLGDTQACRFHGWVTITHRNTNSKSTEEDADRYGIVESRAPLFRVLSVVDTMGQAAAVKLSSYKPLCKGVCVTRRWAAVMYNGMVSLWHFGKGGIADSNRVLEGRALPNPVEKVACDEGGHLLAVLYTAVNTVMLVDMDATLEQRTLVNSYWNVPVADRNRNAQIESVLCWDGMAYALVSRHKANQAGLLCVSTGQWTALCEGKPQAIGGPYFAVSSLSGILGCVAITVFSVVEPGLGVKCQNDRCVWGVTV
ncbi:hypothetical protein Pelo_9307 [Pelomyxa schiedti]|nr:hypothetical protein Pelo_9307 [Pelomyxa schiedti]